MRSISACTCCLIRAAKFAASSLIIKNGIIIRVMSFLRVVLIFVFFCAAALTALGQPDRIMAAVEAADWQTARTEINKLRSTNEGLFRDKSYEYLLGRI